MWLAACRLLTITPQHAAPEVFATFVHVADFSVSTAADMWSLACLLYELCTGCSLFDGKGSATVDAKQLHTTSSSDRPSSSADSANAASLGSGAKPLSATAADAVHSHKSHPACSNTEIAFPEWVSASSCSSSDSDLTDSSTTNARHMSASRRRILEQHKERVSIAASTTCLCASQQWTGVVQ